MMPEQAGIRPCDAATTLEHGLTVVIRNITDFEPTGASVLNPFNRPPLSR
jgi:hypothetical protein